MEYIMKKLLAVIFAMMAGPLFSNSEHSNEVLLLGHLHKIRYELISILVDDEFDREDNLRRLPQEQAQVFAWEDEFHRQVLEEFYRQAGILQEIVTKERARYELEVICNSIGLRFTTIQDKFD